MQRNPAVTQELRGSALVRVGEAVPVRKALDARGHVRLTLTIPPRGAQWVIFEAPRD